MQLRKISHEELNELLESGGIYFYHMKVNGNIKKAFGTRCEGRLPSKALPVPEAIGVTIYYDIVIGQWRSASKKLDIWIES